MEFHIGRVTRDRYQFPTALFSFTGNVIFANITAARQLAHRMNQVRDARKNPEQAVHAAQLYVMGLIDEASHVAMAKYRESLDPAAMADALGWLNGKIGASELDKLLLTFVGEFPGTSVYQGKETAAEWLAGASDGMSHREAALEEMTLLHLANRNKAFAPFAELFDDKTLVEQTAYERFTEELPVYWASRPLVEIEEQGPVSLFDLLLTPALAAPGSLADQLEVILRKWKPLIGDALERFLLIGGELLHEEELAVWALYHPATAEDEARARSEAAEAAEEAARRRREAGQVWRSTDPKSEVPVFGDPANEYEKFSPDTAWMPNTVLIAKSTYVWLAQLSKQYGRSITRLDQIPDEELETLARRGMNSLWLIGVWERSRASQTIKRLCGNPDAVASAYSLFDYKIAEDLGGEAAYINLRDRAYHRGIRLASDMVPNHMGIDSPWVTEHPEWFLSRDIPPYPAYNFEGPNLSADSRVEIRIEKHYFNQTDAAVVFERRDTWSGERRYIYHGNDGTSFPWNDTAQLNYLNPDVREQVIQTILHVARLFPVIRFDAAMTLAKRHFHRLWFPGPGASGSIPSRAEDSMSDAEFNALMPQEFWREVVDRVAAEVPGTLLLAEAFWLMEGYFVRTLGMHRVYNSAFMNMMRDEENAKYRSVIKNTLEFDPDIMKRYVNFMSNPDERTAIDQFGRGDKCFGVAVLMSTLPGLPMFGHGQVEGFTEKYGMEYRWPRYDETADPGLVERHQREIAPLIANRSLFAESHNFLLYDLFEPGGTVNENVFAYSNRNGEQRALVVFQNKYGNAHGTLRVSAAQADKSAGGLRQVSLHDGLGLSADHDSIVAFRDSITGLEYLRRASKLAAEGLTLSLHAYQYHVFLDWRELRATATHPWDKLCDQLNGAGVANLEDALITLALKPVHDALKTAVDPNQLRTMAWLADQLRAAGNQPEKRRLAEAELENFLRGEWRRVEAWLREGQAAHVARTGRELPAGAALTRVMEPVFRKRVAGLLRLSELEAKFAQPWPAAARRVLPTVHPIREAAQIWGPILSRTVFLLLAESIDPANVEAVAVALFDDLRLRQPVGEMFAAAGFEGEDAWRTAARARVTLLVLAAGKKAGGGVGSLIPTSLWDDPDLRWLTGTHAAGGTFYFNKEAHAELAWWLLTPQLCALTAEGIPTKAEVAVVEAKLAAELAAAEKAGYQLERLLAAAKAVKPAKKIAGKKAADKPAKKAAKPVKKAAGKPAAEKVAAKPAKKAVAKKAAKVATKKSGGKKPAKD